MDVSREQVRLLVESCRRNKMTPQETHNFITTAWGDTATSLRSVYRLLKEFTEGRTSLEEKERSGRPASSATVENVEKVNNLIQENNQVSLRALEDLTGIPRSTVYRIIVEKLGLRLVKVRWVPHLLSQDNKEERVSRAEGILVLLRSQRFLRGDKVLVVVDEKMLYHRAIGNKSCNHAWVTPGGDGPCKARRLQIERKTMIIVAVTSDGRFSFEVLERGESINGERYQQFLMRMEHNFRRHVQPLSWNRMLLMHDNARPHTCNKVSDFLQSKGVELVKQPAWSPDFNLLDRYVFASLENARVNIDFDDTVHISQFLTDHLKNVCSGQFSTQLTLLELDLEDIISCSGDYLLE